PDSLIWFGYDRQLFIYNPRQDSLSLYRDRAGRSWAEISGSPISYILPLEQEVYIGTTDAGLYHLTLRNDAIRHWRVDSTANSLRSNRINALHLWEDKDFKVAKDPSNSQAMFLATGSGLHRINTQSGQVTIYDENDGLPNDYLNGILPEGDTALWVSTDHGLCRFSLQTEHCINFFTADGLSSDEFNRISFYRSRDGRLYFGGLNGVNAFSPEPRFLNYRRQRAEVPLLLTSFSYVDALTDSLYRFQLADIDKMGRLDLRYRDRLFNFEFSLADFRHPSQNRYSYYLEGYDQGWSAESTDRRLRFNDLPPGDYTLRVRARVAQEDWAGRQLSLPIRIRQPFYYNWWFWVALISCLALVGLALLRYRIYLAEKQRKELERTVQRRTAELAEEKQKSEELLLNILPAQTAKELKEYGKAVAHRYDQVTVFFSDFVAFTAIANALEPEELVQELDFCFRTFDQIVARYGLEKIKTIGDAYLFIGGLQGQPQAAAVDCVKAALDIQTFLRNHAIQSKGNGRPVFRARIGLHTGPLVTGVVGTHKFAYDIWGETVNVAARMESNSIPEGIVVSDATHHLVKDHFSCQPHGTYEEHGKEMEMWLMGIDRR
ncbi:MAG: adenylate/guanylate cyclase domain-containing protein, partial [Bacteroidota bacterium]